MGFAAQTRFSIGYLADSTLVARRIATINVVRPPGARAPRKVAALIEILLEKLGAR